jgi:hypothetical protein
MKVIKIYEITCETFQYFNSNETVQMKRLGLGLGLQFWFL